MAKLKLTILLSALLMLPFTLTLAHNNTEIVVEGMVYCQSCKYVKYPSLTDAKPILAKVNVICKDVKGDVCFDKVYQTNQDGYFHAELDGFKMTHSILEHPLQACKVKLFASLHANCSIATNINYGLYGAPLRFENKVLNRGSYKVAIYAAGPLAYRPAYCHMY